MSWGLLLTIFLCAISFLIPTILILSLAPVILLTKWILIMQSFGKEKMTVTVLNFILKLCWILEFFYRKKHLHTPRTVNTLGHLDYIVRYSPNRDNNYSVADYIDVIDEILKMIIENDIKLEINTSNFSKGFDFPNPHTDIIRRYKELGGLYVTVGSDAHKAQFVGSGFDLVEKIVEKYKLKIFYHLNCNNLIFYFNLILLTNLNLILNFICKK